MWLPSAPWYEFVIRGATIYAFLLVILRVTGKRQVGQLAPFDLILLLVLSNSVQNAMIGQDSSILGGCITAMTLIGMNYVVSWGTFKSKWLAGIVEGRPLRLIHDGCIDQKALDSCKLTVHELNAALRAEGVACVENVHIAMLENTGRISVVQRSDPLVGHAKEPAS